MDHVFLCIHKDRHCQEKFSKGQCELFKSNISCEDLKEHFEKPGYFLCPFFVSIFPEKSHFHSMAGESLDQVSNNAFNILPYT